MVISGVVFDAFGTIVRIGDRSNPYRELMREGRRQGRALSSDHLHLAMTTYLSIEEIASHLGISLTPAKHDELSDALEREVSSIKPYPDAAQAMAQLRDAGVKIGICSNLAAPYGPVVRDIFPEMHGYAFSYELGVMKPDPSIYLSVCEQMGVLPGQYFSGDTGRVMMIGDSRRCDRDGPRATGICGIHLDRTGFGQIRDLVQFVQKVIERNNSADS
jgi:FMN phosphatase YigB (HAD superfamily)